MNVLAIEDDREILNVVRMGLSETGIPKEDLPRIYERFFRGERGRSAPGSGLGLSLVHAIVAFYGGKIDCSSTLGRGTVFTVSLPWNRK